MPHVPMAIYSSPYGLACPICGFKAPVFTCAMCGTLQMMYLPGQPINSTLIRQMGARGIAPVVQAHPNTNPSLLSNMMRETVISAVKGVGSSLGDQIGDFIGGYFFGDQSY